MGPPGNPKSAKIRVFAAWYEFAEHVRPVDALERVEIEATLSDREREGIAAYQWTVEQIAWRRWTIINKCVRNETKFDEEYPEDP